MPIDLHRLALPLLFALALLAGSWATAAAQEEQSEEDTYDEETMLGTASNFFGETSEGLAEVVKKVFEDQGKPNAYIAGTEVSGSIGIGLRYGNGMLHRKSGETKKVYWQGPSIGFDFGADASKVFVLIYELGSIDDIFHRFPAVEGSFYFVGGVGANYQRRGGITLAPIRTGVGLRAGVNIGYLHYTETHSWIPF